MLGFAFFVFFLVLSFFLDFTDFFAFSAPTQSTAVGKNIPVSFDWDSLLADPDFRADEGNSAAQGYATKLQHLPQFFYSLMVDQHVNRWNRGVYAMCKSQVRLHTTYIEKFELHAVNQTIFPFLIGFLKEFTDALVKNVKSVVVRAKVVKRWYQGAPFKEEEDPKFPSMGRFCGRDVHASINDGVLTIFGVR